MEFYATLGGSCADRATLDGLFAAGMTGARLNLSHTTLPQCAPLLEDIYWPAARPFGRRASRPPPAEGHTAGAWYGTGLSARRSFRRQTVRPGWLGRHRSPPGWRKTPWNSSLLFLLLSLLWCSRPPSSIEIRGISRKSDCLPLFHRLFSGSVIE